MEDKKETFENDENFESNGNVEKNNDIQNQETQEFKDIEEFKEFQDIEDIQDVEYFEDIENSNSENELYENINIDGNEVSLSSTPKYNVYNAMDVSNLGEVKFEKSEFSNDGEDGDLNNKKRINNRGNDKKKTERKRISAFALILMLLISSILGGVASGITVYKIYGDKKTTTKENTASTKKIIADKLSSDEEYTTSYIVENVTDSVVQVQTQATLAYGEGLGTGFIINEDGQVLTNYHVISDVIQGGEINVVFNNGDIHKAKIINYNAENDLALIDIIENITVPGVVELGDSDTVKVGETVIAIGTPLSTNLSNTVTQGIVSALNREVTSSSKDVGNEVAYIQIDAAINFGNSGGPLFNKSGEVIGINSAKISGDGTEGIGFAIPINVAKSLLGELSVEKLLIGISGIDINSSSQELYGIGGDKGFFVKEVGKGSPAEKAGLLPNDVIVKFDGKDVVGIDTIESVKKEHKAGDTIEIVVNRSGKKETLKLTFESK